MRDRHGFTTIELLIVTIIVGVLAAIAVTPSAAERTVARCNESLRNERCKEP